MNVALKTQKEATINSLRILADKLEAGEVDFVRSDVVMAEIQPYPFHAPRRITLFVEVSVG